MVAYLLERGASVSAKNEGSYKQSWTSLLGYSHEYKYIGTGWTALHAASFQEHGRVVRVLLEAGADPFLRDFEDRTPTDYASISEAIWPFFTGIDTLDLILCVRFILK